MNLLRVIPILTVALLILVTVAIHGANLFLKQHSDKVSAILSEHLRDITVEYANAQLLFNWNSIRLQADQLMISDTNGNVIKSVRANFWLKPNNVVIELFSPNITTQPAAGMTLPAISKEWSIIAHNATWRWHSPQGLSITLNNAELKLHYQNNQLGAQIAQSLQDSNLLILASLNFNDADVMGTVYAAINNLPAPANFPIHWQDMRATIKAAINNQNINFTAVGNGETPTTDKIQWRAAGEWNNQYMTVTIAAATPNIAIADYPALPTTNAYWQGIFTYHAPNWQWRGSLIAENADAKIGANITVSGADNAIENINAQINATDMPLVALSHYIPHPPTQEWLSESITQGTIINAAIKANGHPDSLHTEAIVAFEDGNISFDDNWPDTRNISGVLLWQPDDITVIGSANMADISADNIRARIPAVSANSVTLYLDILTNRDLLVHHIAAAKTLPPARDSILRLQPFNFSGDARLSLMAAIPLDNLSETSFAARLALLGNVNIADKTGLPPLEKVLGIADINNQSVIATLYGTFDSEPAAVIIDNNDTLIRGKIAATTLLSIADINDIAAGGKAAFELAHNEKETLFFSDLKGIHLDMPAPLNKNAQSSHARLSARIADNITEAALRLRDNNFYIIADSTGVNIAINESAIMPATAGINIHGNINNLRGADGWLLNNGVNNIALSLAFNDSFLMGIHHPHLAIISPSPKNNTRLIVLAGDSVSGVIFQRPDSIAATLSHVIIDKFEAGDNARFSINDIALTLRINRLQINQILLGELILTGAPDNNNWRISTMRIQQNANTLHIGGEYDGNHTLLTTRLSAGDVTSLLKNFEHPNVISEGVAEVAGTLSWAGAPTDYSTDILNGSLSVNAQNLRYLESEKGVIGLLAIFSPASLIQLGFTEVGKEGIEIQTLQGNIKIKNGIASLEEIIMENDDININLQGDVDLAAQTYNLNGRVRPGSRLLNASSVLAIGATLSAINPATLAAGWLLGKVFEKPLSEIGAYNYTITGDWDNPQYTEISTQYKPPSDSVTQ